MLKNKSEELVQELKGLERTMRELKKTQDLLKKNKSKQEHKLSDVLYSVIKMKERNERLKQENVKR